MVEKYDGEFPEKYYEEFLKFTEISDEEFVSIIDSWRSDHIWEFKNRWQLKNPVWKR